MQCSNFSFSVSSKPEAILDNTVNNIIESFDTSDWYAYRVESDQYEILDY
jgi:hypothetical protein